MKKKSYADQLHESFMREFNNAKKQIDAELKQKPFTYIVDIDGNPHPLEVLQGNFCLN
jgi:hypothetical protein